MYRKITIGRGEYNDLRIPERYDTVSNHHADIEVMDNGMLYITDHSSNGTIVNGVRIHNASKPISYGDRISLSKFYELSWSLVDDFLPRTSAEGHATTRQQHGRQTALYNQDRGINDDYSQPLSYNSARNKEIEVSKNSWSWGGFLLSWIWALGHSCWWPAVVSFCLFILSLISIILFFPLGIIFIITQNLFQIGICIYLGIKGNSIAWENGCFENIEHFRRKEHGWTIAGVIVLLLFFVLPILIGLISVFVLGMALF